MCCFAFLLAVVGWALSGFSVAMPPQGTPRSSAQTPAADEAAIRAKVQALVAAYNRGDAAAVAGHYAKDGEFVDRTGHVVHGRDGIQKELEAFFAKNKGAKLELKVDSVRPVTADVVIERGTSLVSTTAVPAQRSRYTAVHVRRDGQWLIESVRETADTQATVAESPLHDLDWMTGEWIEVGGDSVVHTICEWTPSKKYLFRTFTCYLKDRIDIAGTEIVGWDPAAKNIRSWTFDSEGGFGEGSWSKKADRWIVKVTGYQGDGKKTSAIRSFRQLDSNRIVFQVTSREIDGKLQPNTDEIVLVRKQPK